MTLELLNTRLSEIEKALEQSMANINMLIGGKQECLHWIKQLSSEVVKNEMIDHVNE